eukprot:2220967-Amphidinium_carterae.3
MSADLNKWTQKKCLASHLECGKKTTQKRDFVQKMDLVLNGQNQEFPKPRNTENDQELQKKTYGLAQFQQNVLQHVPFQACPRTP